MGVFDEDASTCPVIASGFVNSKEGTWEPRKAPNVSVCKYSNSLLGFSSLPSFISLPFSILPPQSIRLLFRSTLKINTMWLRPLLFGSLSRQVTAMAVHPAATITTILHYSRLLPRDLAVDLERHRFIRHELIDQHDFLFNFIVTILTCFW
ncbi:unnamed protein product [Lactuca virosa]|uniref:Uncharacterized protein n=1 Tax=Lactuca virosa TaxID=75947 RepID=A0AAU9LRR2_9ASTR|nr:unnamed protein product [Lactuca virosa]